MFSIFRTENTGKWCFYTMDSADVGLLHHFQIPKPWFHQLSEMSSKDKNPKTAPHGQPPTSYVLKKQNTLKPPTSWWLNHHCWWLNHHFSWLNHHVWWLNHHVWWWNHHFWWINRPVWAAALIMLSCSSAMATRLKSNFPPLTRLGEAKGYSTPWSKVTCGRFTNIKHLSMDWFKGKSSPETMVFTIKYRGFL